MPAITPNRPSRKEAFFKSFRKTDTSFSVTNSSIHRSSGSRPFTMYDKVYSPVTKHRFSRISKNTTRRRVTEVERCTNIEQREQYRQLIERYCKKTLAETEKLISSSSQTNSNSAKENIQPPTIIIPDTPVSSIFYTKSRPHCDKQDQVPSFLEASTEQSTTSKYSLYRRDVSKRSAFSEKPDTSNEKEKKVSFNCAPSNSTATPHTSFNSSAQLCTPKTQQVHVANWFSPPSPYLSNTFIKDLVGSYGRKERERKKKVHEEETRARLLKEKREMREDILSELLEARLHVKPVPEIVIPELSEEQLCIVDGALNICPQHEVLREKFNISITRQHMATLDGLNWLNDEIINFYMELIVERSNTQDNLPKAHAMNTFFYPKLGNQGYKSVRRWTKRVDIFSKDILFYPIHLGVHWTLAVIDFREKSITYFDSMGGDNQKCLQTLKNYLVAESEDKKKTTYDVTDWKLINKAADEIPQQLNGSDCGVFACTFAEFLGRNAALSFLQKDMPRIRRTMVWEIMNGSLTR